jgi:hypothetical protein
MIWKQAKGSIYQLEKGIQDFLPKRLENHIQEETLISSTIDKTTGKVPLKITLLRSFQIFQVVMVT